MQLTVGVKTHFDAAHFLPDHKGKCKNLHGHTWHVMVEVTGEINPAGMVADFSFIKRLVEEEVEKLDHNNLNTIVPNPTCESLVEYFVYRLQAFDSDSIILKSVQIQEGEGGWVRWEK